MADSIIQDGQSAERALRGSGRERLRTGIRAEVRAGRHGGMAGGRGKQRLAARVHAPRPLA